MRKIFIIHNIEFLKSNIILSNFLGTGDVEVWLDKQLLYGTAIQTQTKSQTELPPRVKQVMLPLKSFLSFLLPLSNHRTIRNTLTIQANSKLGICKNPNITNIKRPLSDYKKLILTNNGAELSTFPRNPPYFKIESTDFSYLK